MCVYIVYCLVVCAVTDFSAEDAMLAASHFARRFISVHGIESQFFVNFAPPELKFGRIGGFIWPS